ncbi:hypothetical protein D3C75_590510 [compost metagenome]
MKVITPDDSAPLLGLLTRIHVDGTKVGEGCTYIVDFVILHDMVVAEDQHAGMGRIMELIMRHPVADT